MATGKMGSRKLGNWNFLVAVSSVAVFSVAVFFRCHFYILPMTHE